MDVSFRLGRVKVGPLMLVLGLMIHVLVPGVFLVGAYGLDVGFGWRLTWPLWVRLPLGATILLLSVVLEALSFPPFIRSGGSPSPFHQTESLIVTGPYRYCRHPIYAAYFGFILGPGIMLGLRSSFLTAALWWLCLAVEARFFEEPSLQRRFGEQFEAYRRTTPFTIPRFWRRR